MGLLGTVVVDNALVRVAMWGRAGLGDCYYVRERWAARHICWG